MHCRLTTPKIVFQKWKSSVSYGAPSSIQNLRSSFFFFPSTTFFATLFQHFLFFRDFSACKRHRKLRDEWHMQNMASKEKLLKVTETNFLIIFALLPQFKALLPRYVPVLQPGYVERHDLIECYFKLELQHREILAFLMLSNGIVSASAGENFGSQGITQKA